MKYATIRRGDATMAGVIDPHGGLFTPFDPVIRDVAAAIPLLLDGASGFGAPMALSDVTLCAPIVNPPHNIICCGQELQGACGGVHQERL
jgi:hypothetical protein